MDSENATSQTNMWLAGSVRDVAMEVETTMIVQREMQQYY